MKTENQLTFGEWCQAFLDRSEHEAHHIASLVCDLAEIPPSHKVDVASLVALSAQLCRAEAVFFLEKEYPHHSWVMGLAAYRRAVAAQLQANPELRRLRFPLCVATTATALNVNLLTVGVARAGLWAAGLVLPAPGHRKDVQRLGELLGVGELLVSSFDLACAHKPKFAPLAQAASRRLVKCLKMRVSAADSLFFKR